MDQNLCGHRHMFGNNQGNFQLHRFTRRDNTAKSFRGATFLTHTVDLILNDYNIGVGGSMVQVHPQGES